MNMLFMMIYCSDLCYSIIYKSQIPNSVSILNEIILTKTFQIKYKQFLIQIFSCCLYSIIKVVLADLIQVPLLPLPPFKIWSRSLTWWYPCVLLCNNDHNFFFIFKIKRDGWRRGAIGMERGVTYHLQNRTRLPKLLSVSPSPTRSILKIFQQDCGVYVATYCTCM